MASPHRTVSGKPADDLPCVLPLPCGRTPNSRSHDSDPCTAGGLATPLPVPLGPGRRRRPPARHHPRCPHGRRQPWTLAEATDLARHLETAVHRAAGTTVQAGRAVRPGAASRPSAPGRSEGGPHKAQQVFQRGLAAFAQWTEGKGQRPVPRSRRGQITVEGGAEPVSVRLGAWILNTKSRRDRLDADQLAALAELGIAWA
jgi:hypothetical protein